LCQKIKKDERHVAFKGQSEIHTKVGMKNLKGRDHWDFKGKMG
jgi:hypothetical protein